MNGGFDMEQKQEKFSTIGYIAAALGMCIGTGNVWRFPRVCAANGGGAFIIAWTIAMLVFAVPLLSTEMAFGKKTRLGCIGTFRDAGGKKYTWMGFFVAAVCFFLMSYYCVLQGYCMKYAVNSVNRDDIGNVDSIYRFTGTGYFIPCDRICTCMFHRLSGNCRWN